MKEIQAKIIENCYNLLKITNRNDAAILGYCVKLSMSITQNNDGSLSYCGFFEHKNSEQWEAERTIDEAIKELKK